MLNNRKVTSLLAAGLLVLMIAGGAYALPSFIGSLMTDTASPGIVGTGFWTATGPTQIQWSAAQLANGSWRYIYVLDVPIGTVDRFLLESSPLFTISDILSVSGDFTSVSVVDLAPPDPSDPNLPGAIHAIQFTGAPTNSAAVLFTSTRAPVWGDFYAQNGNSGNPPGVINSAWNAGFTLPDPTSPPTDGSIDNKLLVPDSFTAVPDASTLALTSIGVLPVLVTLRRRRRGQCERTNRSLAITRGEVAEEDIC